MALTEKVITIKRMIFTEESTIGELYLPDEEKRFCYTLEDPVRKEKVYGKTAIPSGRYRLVIDESKRFKRMLPHILDVPFFDGIRIHTGNVSSESEGCILVGQNKELNKVTESRIAFNRLFPKLEEYLKEGTLFIEFIGGYSPEEWVKS